jgi:hypothetical protein
MPVVFFQRFCPKKCDFWDIFKNDKTSVTHCSNNNDCSDSNDNDDILERYYSWHNILLTISGYTSSSGHRHHWWLRLPKLILLIKSYNKIIKCHECMGVHMQHNRCMLIICESPAMSVVWRWWVNVILNVLVSTNILLKYHHHQAVYRTGMLQYRVKLFRCSNKLYANYNSTIFFLIFFSFVEWLHHLVFWEQWLYEFILCPLFQMCGILVNVPVPQGKTPYEYSSWSQNIHGGRIASSSTWHTEWQTGYTPSCCHLWNPQINPA